MKEMLKSFIKVDHYFTLEALNGIMAKYDYGYYNDKNKPSAITEQKLASNDNNLKQHGEFTAYHYYVRVHAQIHNITLLADLEQVYRREEEAIT